MALGLIDAPLSFLYNELGVIIGTVNVLLPFLVLPLFAAMIKIDEQLLRAACVSSSRRRCSVAAACR